MNEDQMTFFKKNWNIIWSEKKRKEKKRKEKEKEKLKNGLTKIAPNLMVVLSNCATKKVFDSGWANQKVRRKKKEPKRSFNNQQNKELKIYPIKIPIHEMRFCQLKMTYVS